MGIMDSKGEHVFKGGSWIKMGIMDSNGEHVFKWGARIQRGIMDSNGDHGFKWEHGFKGGSWIQMGSTYSNGDHGFKWGAHIRVTTHPENKLYFSSSSLGFYFCYCVCGWWGVVCVMWRMAQAFMHDL